MTNQQLKAHCEDVIANPQDHPDWVVDMAKALLPCLMAEPVAYIHPKMLDAMSGDDGRDCGRVWKSSIDEVSNEQRIPLCTAPPAPELKPIELPQLISSWEGDDVISGRNRGINDCAEALRKQGYEVKS